MTQKKMTAPVLAHRNSQKRAIAKKHNLIVSLLRIAVKMAAIALHFVNYQAQEVQGDTVDYGAIIDEATRTVEEELHVSIDKDGFNYYRFVTHMHYMMKRTQNDQMIVSQNQDIFESLCQEFPDVALQKK